MHWTKPLRGRPEVRYRFGWSRQLQLWFPRCKITAGPWNGERNRKTEWLKQKRAIPFNTHKAIVLPNLVV
jgi:hypothetical protein